MIFGYMISVLFGIPVTWLLSWGLHKTIQRYRTEADQDAMQVRILWIPIVIGIVERTIITTMIAWNISGTAGFIGAWVAIKSAVGWQMWARKSTTYERTVLFAGLIGSAVSVLFALIGGILVAARK